ncbi:aconitase X swivel domain-containing protein [Priestia megaterium]|uniref:aconitase X swivel domain-containing protein n=1 Tax=Priestia megaterium TaxID=1404 RepID=UPI0027952673|nr:DUF126 domain-containing protein [Priestia megaterium]
MGNLEDEKVIELKGDIVVNGEGEGGVISTSVPLSFWGGLDPSTGKIIDKYHPLKGRVISGKIFILPEGRGSCTGSGVLVEAITSGNAPSGLILRKMDEVIILGGIVAAEIFAQQIPIIVLNDDDFKKALNSSYAKIRSDGYVTIMN